MKSTRPLLLLLVAAGLLVYATPALSQGNCRFYNETGRRTCGRLLDYWDQNGALPVFGYPIADQAGQSIEGRTFQAQLFQRERMELHPENNRPYDVLLGRLGADELARAGRDWTTFPKDDPSAPHYFAKTGHAIAPQFWGYWSSHGLEFDGRPGTSFAESLALFGMPLSEPTMEVNLTNGQPYLTQWFERARFEYHPENAGTPYDVLLGLLGSESAGMRTPPPPALPAFAAEMIALVNQQRAAAGCPALVANDALMSIAQSHSQDMAAHDFFDHDGSDGRTPFQRMLDAGYHYRRAAENIAYGVKSPADAVALWMNSAPHRANILDCALRETGVGYVDDPGDRLHYGSYWTQDFGTR